MNGRSNLLVRDVMEENFIVMDGLATVQEGIDTMVERNVDSLFIRRRAADDEHGIVVLAASSGAITRLTMAIHVDQDVHRRPGGVLERVADRVADHAGGLGGRALAAVVALLDVLLGVVPGTAGVGHHQRQQHAAEQGAAEHAAEGRGAETQADDHRRSDGDGAGQDHAPQGRRGGDVHAACRVRLRLAFEQARYLVELAADLLDHRRRHRRRRSW
jgi:hypothetical protein